MQPYQDGIFARADIEMEQKYQKKYKSMLDEKDLRITILGLAYYGIPDGEIAQRTHVDLETVHDVISAAKPSPLPAE